MTVSRKPTTAAALAAVIGDTFQEARARWLFWGLFGLSTFLVLLFLFALNIDIVQGAQATIAFGPRSRTIYDIHKFVNVAYSWVALALYYWETPLAIFASAGLVPVLLEPGRIALLLSKPIARTTLLAGRFFGNILIVAANSTYLIVIVWIILGTKTGIWGTRFLLAIPASIFMFTVLLTMVVLIGVVAESAALAVMVSVATMLISALLAQREWANKLLSSDWSRQVWTGLYWIVPKVYDLGSAIKQIIVFDRSADWITPVWTSTIFAAAVLTGALVIFNKRDF
jgi:ABC-type transport system involved in multi-copper enzyme maturation permease subunit